MINVIYSYNHRFISKSVLDRSFMPQTISGISGSSIQSVPADCQKGQ